MQSKVCLVHSVTPYSILKDWRLLGVKNAMRQNRSASVVSIQDYNALATVS
jgi:hypothetical protein